MKMRRTLAVALAMSTLAASALADSEPPRADDRKVTEAKQRMVEGKRLYAQQKYEDAWLKFVQACAVLQTEKCITGLAIMEYAAGKHVDAYNHLRGLLEPRPKASLTPQQIDELTRAMADSSAKTGHLKVDAPEGAVIMVDDSQVGLAPLSDTVTVMPGVHHVEARLPGHSLFATTEAVLAAEVTPVTLTEAQRPDPASTPVLTSAAPVSLTAPQADLPSPSGARASWIASPVVPVVLGAVAAGLTTGGIASLTAANNDETRASHLREANHVTRTSCASSSSPACSAVGEAVDSGVANRSRELGFFVGAGVALGAIGAWFLWGHGDSSHAASVSPVVGPGIAGGSLTGRF